jgi:hypothetical protein
MILVLFSTAVAAPACEKALRNHATWNGTATPTKEEITSFCAEVSKKPDAKDRRMLDCYASEKA